MNLPSEAQLLTEIQSAARSDQISVAAVQSRVDAILRPAGALSRLDELAVWLAGWQRTETPTVDIPVAIIFAGDHGVTVEGVSAYPPDVTGAMLAAFQQQKASVSAIASVSGTSVHAVDVGVGRPTGNLRIEPAMSDERFAESFAAGREAVARLDADQNEAGGSNKCRPDVYMFGEMGIGNTTAAAAVAASLFIRSISADLGTIELGTIDIAQFVGRGTGVGVEEYNNKVQVVTDAVHRFFAEAEGNPDQTTPLNILQELGGSELVAIAGAMVEARMRSFPVLLDGYIASVPAVALQAVNPELVANVRAAHLSAEPGHRLLLAQLNLTPLLDLEMRLGEASGAVAAVPLLQMACKLVTDVPTFSEWFDPQP